MIDFLILLCIYFVIYSLDSLRSRQINDLREEVSRLRDENSAIRDQEVLQAERLHLALVALSKRYA